jgi:adenylate cyclase
MNSTSNNVRRTRQILVICLLFMTGVALISAWRGNVWMTYDAMALDYFYRRAVDRGHGPQAAFMPRITYLTITDDTYRFFGKNILDRRDLARINRALSSLSPRAVAYDMIFAMPGPLDSDKIFARSLRALGSVYLPMGCALSETPVNLRETADNPGGPFPQGQLIRLRESGTAAPIYAARILTQQKRFSAAAKGTGDISAWADPDGVYRHVTLLIRMGEQYLPNLCLSMFLDHAGIQRNNIKVKWGKSIELPPGNDPAGSKPFKIPINNQGQMVIPFVAPMGEDFPAMPVHTFLKAFKNEDLRGNLAELIEGNFIIIADTATGVGDRGATPLEKSVPLVTLHASVLNGLLTQTFYAPWPSIKVVILIFLIMILLGFSTLFNSARMLYASGFSMLIFLPVLTWYEFIHFRLFPVVTGMTTGGLLFIFLVIALEYAASKEKAMIRNVFSRYVPTQVISELLADPKNLTLGGEERTATVLFSDIAGFTSISEQLPPQTLVSLLNQYLTEMTNIVLAQGGIIDKFQGDAIMAEFGVPLPCADHADRAVSAGLLMQTRLAELRHKWKKKGLPELHCRIGINTGVMVVGNMGSSQVQDYTVIGDAVNLASRLEGANKFYGTHLMISEFTLNMINQKRYNYRVLDVIKVKGKTKPVTVYEVYGWEGRCLEKKQAEYYSCYERGFAAYLERDFKLSKTYFQKALGCRSDDPASSQMLLRLKNLSLNSLPPDWDGAVTLSLK